MLEKRRIVGVSDDAEQVEAFARLGVRTFPRYLHGTTIVIECAVLESDAKEFLGPIEWARIEDENIGSYFTSKSIPSGERRRDSEDLHRLDPSAARVLDAPDARRKTADER